MSCTYCADTRHLCARCGGPVADVLSGCEEPECRDENPQVVPCDYCAEGD